MNSPSPQSAATVAVDGDRRPSMAIVELVARETGTDVVELAPLYDAIDPDVLDSLLRSDGFSSLEFRYEGRTVVLEDASDEVRISLQNDATADASGDVVDTESSI
ncbi:HalOD1 output domain-containing protein [Natronobacterium lacisalsi]|nr:HalOD1 output domain-containing protein [Halobiforma lacisalsi]